MLQTFYHIKKRAKLNKNNLLLIRDQAEDLYDRIYSKKLSVKKFESY